MKQQESGKISITVLVWALLLSFTACTDSKVLETKDFLLSIQGMWAVERIEVPGIYSIDQEEYFEELQTQLSTVSVDASKLKLIELNEEYFLSELQLLEMSSSDFLNYYYGSGVLESDPILFLEGRASLEIWEGEDWSFILLEKEKLILKYSNALIYLKPSF